MGDPINASNGNKYQEDTDYQGGKWLTFSRYYNSQLGITGEMGTKWRNSFDRSLSTPSNPNGAPPNTIVLFRPDGSQEDFTEANGVWMGDTALIDSLTEIDNAQGVATGYTLFNGVQRTTETYNAAGVLQSIVDETGQGVTLTYSTASTSTSVAPFAGLLLTVTDPRGRQLSFTYNSNGTLHQVTQPDNGVLTYGYNSADNLTSVEYPDTNTRQYVYNESALTGGANLVGALTGIVDEAGVRYASTTYNSSGLATSSTFADGAYNTALTYNSDGSATVQYPLGHSATIGFTTANGFNRTSAIDQPCGPECGQPWQSLTYDANGYPASTTDFKGNLTSTQYDAYGLLEQQVDAQGQPTQRTTKTTWDTTLRVPLERTVSDANGNLVTKTDWVYNGLGEVHVRCEIDPTNPATAGYTCADSGTPPAGVRRWIYHYCGSVDTIQCPVVGLLLTVDGPRTDVSDVTSYAYYMLDGVNHHHGDLKSITDPMGLVTTYLIYDGAGRITAMQRPDGVYEDSTYTPRGWLASKTVRITSDNSPSSFDATTTITYWPYGAVKTITDPDGVITSYTYDAAHRLTDITDALGKHIHYTLDAAGNKTEEQTFTLAGAVVRSVTRGYNALGELTSVADGFHQTVFSAGYSDSYDANGNLVHSADGLSIQQHQSYDALNRLAQTIQNYEGTDPATENTTTGYTRDSLDRLTGVTDPSGLLTSYGYDGLSNATGQTSPDTGSTTRTFDAAGNMATRTDAKGIIATYTYDADNRLTSISYPDSTQNVAYHYDEANTVTGCGQSRPLGRLTRIVEAGVTTVYCYGGHGMVAEKQQITAGHTDTTIYSYTPANRLSTIQTPDNTLVSYTYNSNGLAFGVQVTPSGASTATTVVSNISWYPFGLISSYTLGNGQTITRSYDANYRLTDLTSPAFNLHLARDVMGDVQAVGSAPGANPASETYYYDPLYRLQNLIEANGSTLESYTYDLTGDRLSKTATDQVTGGGTYAYTPGTHQLASIGTGARSNDANGNTTGSVMGGNTYGFGYNDRNRLGAALRNGQTVASYTYDALGQRIGKVATFPQAVTERFGYNEADQLVGEYGTTNRDYVWMGDIPVAVIDNTTSGGVTTSTVNYVTADQLGTPRAVSNSAGTVIWSWAYQGNPFGEQPPTSSTGYVLNLRYPGQYFDAETGTSYNVNRSYEPATGRYLQSDPLGLMSGISTYAYVGGDPLHYVDPAGLQIAVPVPVPEPDPLPFPEVPLPTHNYPSVGPNDFCAVAGPLCLGAAGVEGMEGGNVIPFPTSNSRPTPRMCPPDNGCEADQEFLMTIYTAKLSLITNTPGIDPFAIRNIALSYNVRAVSHNKRCPNFPVPLLPTPRPYGI